MSNQQRCSLQALNEVDAPERRQRLREAAERRASLSTREVASEAGVGKRRARKWLRELVADEYFMRIGHGVNTLYVPITSRGRIRALLHDKASEHPPEASFLTLVASARG